MNTSGPDKGRFHAEEEDTDSIWLISYSDMMTLLFGFFVLMFALAQSRSPDQEKIKKGISKAFGGSYKAPDEVLAKKIKKLAEKAVNAPEVGTISVDQVKDGLEITFRSSLLFPSAKASLRPEGKRTLSMIIDTIMANVNHAEIMVAGHTDDIPIHTLQYPSNWELSAARAATVVKQFEQKGYDKKLLVVMGYGSSRPTFPNRTPDGIPIPQNEARNRRVVIKVTSPGADAEPTPVNGIADRRSVNNEKARAISSTRSNPASAPRASSSGRDRATRQPAAR